MLWCAGQTSWFLLICTLVSLLRGSPLSRSSWISTISTWRWTIRWLWRCCEPSWPTFRPAGGWRDGPRSRSPSPAACWVKSVQRKLHHMDRAVLRATEALLTDDRALIWVKYFVWARSSKLPSPFNVVWLACLTVEDGDALDPCILSTLRKLQDGYFAGARSVSILSLLCRCPLSYVGVVR